MNLLYTQRYKYANLLNVVVFILVVAGVSTLYGKLQLLESKASSGKEDHSRLLQHETDLSAAQETINKLTSEIEALRRELQAQRQAGDARDGERKTRAAEAP